MTNEPTRAAHPADYDAGWRLGPKRWDWLRAIHCAIAGHRWEVNQRETQRVCERCWLVQDRLVTPTWGHWCHDQRPENLPVTSPRCPQCGALNLAAARVLPPEVGQQ